MALRFKTQVRQAAGQIHRITTLQASPVCPPGSLTPAPLWWLCQSKLLETLRETYEGFVIYSFFQLLLQYLGGQQGILEVFRRKVRATHCLPSCLRA